jgi:hypothetical protein
MEIWEGEGEEEVEERRKMEREREREREREEEEETIPPTICSASTTACKIPTAMIGDLRRKISRMA